MKLKNKKVLVLGLGKSGISSINFLLEQNANVSVFDDDQLKLLDYLKTNSKIKVLEYQTENTIREFNFIVVSPGVKKTHNIISIAKYCEVPCISEIELFYYVYNPYLIGITGSNGKTTTTTLLNEMLNKKYKTMACGNIGMPVCDTKNYKLHARVVETSSFQLSYVNKLRYNISVILNLTENHLNWHFNFSDYISAKANIFKNSKKNDILILNADDKNMLKLNLVKTKCRVLWFSLKKECKGIFVEKDKLIVNLNKKETVCNLSDINLLGEHNLQNVMVCVLIAKLLNLNNKIITQTLKTFKGVEHRLENFYSFRGIDCFNDSKSTTVQSTLCAIKALKNYEIILIVGGSNKNLNYDGLAKNIPQNVKQIYVYGQTKGDICESLNKYNKGYINCENLNEAILNSVTNSLSLTHVNNTLSQSVNGSKKVAILFSPASASFDLFNSFEERGVYFKEYLKSCVEDCLN